MKKSPVVHFEIPGEDGKRMTEFYTTAFGWEANELGEDMGNYILVMTTESDEMGPKRKGAINGGFFQKTEDNPQKHPSVVISVENIKEHVKKVEDAGGKVIGEPMQIPGIGWYVSFYDTEGNLLSMIEPSAEMR